MLDSLCRRWVCAMLVAVLCVSLAIHPAAAQNQAPSTSAKRLGLYVSPNTQPSVATRQDGKNTVTTETWTEHDEYGTRTVVVTTVTDDSSPPNVLSQKGVLTVKDPQGNIASEQVVTDTYNPIGGYERTIVYDKYAKTRTHSETHETYDAGRHLLSSDGTATDRDRDTGEQVRSTYHVTREYNSDGSYTQHQTHELYGSDDKLRVRTEVVTTVDANGNTLSGEVTTTDFNPDGTSETHTHTDTFKPQPNAAKEEPPATPQRIIPAPPVIPGVDKDASLRAIHGLRGLPDELPTHQARQDPTDPTRAFDPTTGQNLHWDPSKQTWVDSRTGQDLGFDGALASDGAIVPAPPIIPGVDDVVLRVGGWYPGSPGPTHQARQDPTDPTRAFDSTTGQNLHWDPNKQTWVDSQTGRDLGFDGALASETPAVAAHHLHFWTVAIPVLATAAIVVPLATSAKSNDHSTGTGTGSGGGETTTPSLRRGPHPSFSLRFRF